MQNARANVMCKVYIYCIKSFCFFVYFGWCFLHVSVMALS